MNAVIHASRKASLGGRMYLVGIDAQNGTPFQDGAEPGRLCKRVIINAGIEEVVTRNRNGDLITYKVRDWIANENSDYGIKTLSHCDMKHMEVPRR